MKKRITIKDIARELNIHHSTVSRALRNDSRVNEKTKELILEYAKTNEYQANLSALQLRGAKSNAIALIVPNINHSFFSDIVSKLTNLAFERGYVISVFQSNESYNQEKEIVNTIIQHDFAGVIVSIAKNTINSDHFRLLKKFGIPLVFFDRVCEDIDTPKVLVDNFSGVFSATEYLINKGYRRVAHITGNSEINVFHDRHRGYLAAVQKCNSGFKNSQELNEDFSVDLGKRIFNLWLSGDEMPDAVICSSVHVSMGILIEAKRNNLRIPEDLGLITFGTFLSSEAIEPRITSIEQPENEIAELTFSLLEELIASKGTGKIIPNRVVQTNMFVRESC